MLLSSPWRRRQEPAVWLVGGLALLLGVTADSATGISGRPVAAISHDHGRAPETPARQIADTEHHVPAGHDGAEGLTLVATREETVGPGPACPTDAPIRRYNVLAINVDITLNRYLAHDPEGRMFVLADDLDRVRAEEEQNAAARGLDTPSGVSIGLQGDAIQPLTLRVNQGECLKIILRNELRDGEPASLHLHESEMRVALTGGLASATNPDAIVATGGTATYEWMVAADEPEGTHYFHSEADLRRQTSHGLFGALIVEPAGSIYRDPLTGGALKSGWAAIIEDPAGPDFREFALYYHEIGDEDYRILDKSGAFVPIVDPLTSAYRPGGRALNYRSEPFLDRLALQQSATGRFDESVAYSSYAFGDPATPVARSYLGDPAKERVIHGGSEVAHVHHVHGGSIRWRRQPDAEQTTFASGLQKHPDLVPQATERVDSQSIGPSETFDVENECGSGGCQQSVGDYLFHCHIAQHYFAGMWGIWRVYNTLQDGLASTDSLPALVELPDRAAGVAPAVQAGELIGRTVGLPGSRSTITTQGLAEWVERQLPPPGVPKGYDASVFDWRRDGDGYYGEPETTVAWPGYASASPGTRPAITFDPRTGKIAYPFLRPHLGARPPFAPGHGPAPYLDPGSSSRGPPEPGASGPDSLCPSGTRRRDVALAAVSVPVTLNQRTNLVDPNGALFVLRSDEESVRADDALKRPLAIRTNAGEDCLDITLTSELNDRSGANTFSKVGVHIHFVQFDIQASDGLDTGFNYEQTIRPYTEAGDPLATAARAGSRSIELLDAGRFQPGVLVGVGLDRDDGFETRTIVRIEGQTVVLDEALATDHAAGEIVSTEFVRHRWYPDVQFGTAYFHDHVNAISSWRHGLFGALIAEPPGSSYHDPKTGAEISSGPIADIHTDGRVSPDATGSFRELVLFIQDDTDLNRVGRSTGSSFNLRAEPLDGRAGDPAELFSSARHGDPETPILEAYVGDPLVIRTLVAGTNDVHSLHLDGHWFRAEPYSIRSPPTSTVHIGISERYDLVVPAAGGPQRMPGDYLYYNGRSFKLREGSWGILRVRAEPDVAALKPLPGQPVSSPSPPSVCPEAAPIRRYTVAAIEAPLPMLGDATTGRLYVLQEDKQGVLSGAISPVPLVLHVNVGDCVEVELSNETSDGKVSFHVDQLAFDPRTSGGVTAGMNQDQTVGPGGTRIYRFFADPTVGETVALVRDWGDVGRNPRLGLYGAIVVGPEGATYRDPMTGADMSAKAAWAVVVTTPTETYRDFSLFLQDEDESIGTHRMPYTTRVQGVVGLNYQAEPIADRIKGGASSADAFRSDVFGDPSTPVLEAFAGDPLRVHVLAPWSEQVHVFSIDGHRWPFEPGRAGGDRLSSMLLAGLEAVTLQIERAGGPDKIAGDYVYGDHRAPYLEAGLWGLVRVHQIGSPDTRLRPLAEGQGEGANTIADPPNIVASVPLLVAVFLLAGLGLLFAGLLGARRWVSRTRPK